MYISDQSHKSKVFQRFYHLDRSAFSTVFSKCIYLIRTDVTVIRNDVTVIRNDVTVIRTDVPVIDVILLISISVFVPCTSLISSTVNWGYSIIIINGTYIIYIYI